MFLSVGGRVVSVGWALNMSVKVSVREVRGI